MKKCFFLLFLTNVSLFAYPQKQIINEIADDYCNRAKLAIENMSKKEEIYDIIKTIGVETNKVFRTEINEIQAEIRAADSTATQMEILKQFGYLISTQLIENCDSYIEMLRLLLPPCPEENKTLIIMRERIEEIIEKNKHLTYSEQINLADNSMFDIITENETQVNLDYKDGVSNFNLPNEVGDYLLHKSLKYYKLFLHVELINTTK